MDALFAPLQNAVAGRYSLDRELGRGGMAVVYLARDVALDRPVAIKLAQSDTVRFLREARTAAGLAHPNIVPIHLVEEKNDLVYFVMGYVDGETLGDRVRRTGPLPPAEASRIIREVAWALAYAHGRGIIHRDIKPDNILIEKGSGRAMVTDFGIARVVSRSTVSQQGEILGTVQYMAPEQADPDAVLDGRVDLYALGATAFYALTGRLPFEADTTVALIAMHLTEPAPPVTSVRDAIPPKLAEAIDRCLVKSPDARFATAEALADALGDAVTVGKAIPPSIMRSRDAVISLFNTVLFTAPTYFLVRSTWPEQATALGWLTIGVTVIGGLTLLAAAREAVRDGHTTREIADLLSSMQTVSDRTLAVTESQFKVFNRFMRRPVGRVIAAGFGSVYFWIGIETAWKVFARGFSRGAIDYLALVGMIASMGLGGVCWRFALMLGRFKTGTNLIDVQKAQHRVARWNRWIWDTLPMRAFFRLAGLGLKKPKAQPVVEKAATEVLLGKAADDLFGALSKEMRARLKDVPDVIKSLEKCAQALRARRDDLAKAIGDAGQAGGARRDQIVAELEAAKNEAAERLAAAVTALENLRLDLLRLRAGVGSSDDLTGSLEEARRIGYLVDAERELADLGVDRGPGVRPADRLVGRGSLKQEIVAPPAGGEL